MTIGDSFRNAQVRVGDPLGMTSKLAYLVADNTNIDCTGICYLELTSNNTTASNRTFTLTSSSLKGHELFIVFTSGSSNKAELADSGTCRLAESTMTFTQYKSIKLVSDGTYWYEQVRGANTTLTNQQTVALVGDNQAVDPTGYSSTLLTSDSTQTGRTFTLTASALAGITHRLVFISATNRCELAIAATMKINDHWVPAQYDSLNLISDGTRWIELSRSLGNSAGQVSTAALIGDNQAVATEGQSKIFITSDSTQAARTMTITASPVIGQVVTLVFTSASNRAELAISSTMKLRDPWYPAQYDSLTLISDGTRWIELSRTYGNSAGQVASVSLIGDNQSVVTEGLSLIILTSDDATAANRTFVPVASPRVGHELTLLWNSANEGQLADTATVTLVTGAWEPTNLYQSIRLISDGTRWIEVCRADPT